MTSIQQQQQDGQNDGDGQTGLNQMTSSARSRWYPDNSIVDLPIDRSPQTEPNQVLLVNAGYEFVIQSMTWNVHTKGIAQDVTNLDKHERSLISWALVHVKRGEQIGRFNMDPLAEDDTSENAPLYSIERQVIAARLFYSTGYEWKESVSEGFAEGQYRGPIRMQPGDRIMLLGVGSDNFDNPTNPISTQREFGHVNGTLTYSTVE